MSVTENKFASPIPAAAHRTDLSGRSVSAGPTGVAARGLGNDQSGFPRRLFAAIGAFLIVGLGITFIVVHAADPGSSGLAVARSVASLPELPEPAIAPLPAGPVPPPALKGSVRDTRARMPGPTGRVAVPSAGLRTHPSLAAKAMSRVVKKNERVTILARFSAESGPEWMKIATTDGKIGWVWASVVREQGRRDL